MKADSLQPPSTPYRMIEAHGDRALIDSFLLKRASVSEHMATRGGGISAVHRGIYRCVAMSHLGANFSRPSLTEVLMCALPWTMLLGMGTILTAAPAQTQTYDPRYPVCMQVYS